MTTKFTNFPHNKKRCVYVGGLNEQVTSEVLHLTLFRIFQSLHAAMIPFGDIIDINMPLDYQNNKHRGFAFVEFELAEDAAAAIDNLNDSELFGSKIFLFQDSTIRSQAERCASTSRARRRQTR